MAKVISATRERGEPAYRVVVRIIEARIMSGEWAVGHRLPSEAALADMFNVNRSTIREAIRALEQNGLVGRHDGGKLLYVTAPREADISRRVTAAIVLHEISFFELWESMRCFEPALAECAAKRIDDATLDALRINVEKTKAALENKQGLAELDIEFHQIIARASRNRALQLSREPMSRMFYPAFLRVFSRLNAGERLVFAHEKIFHALTRRDAAEARIWMDKHIVDFRRGYELANFDIDKPVGWPMPTDPAARQT